MILSSGLSYMMPSRPGPTAGALIELSSGNHYDANASATLKKNSE